MPLITSSTLRVDINRANSSGGTLLGSRGVEGVVTRGDVRIRPAGFAYGGPIDRSVKTAAPGRQRTVRLSLMSISRFQAFVSAALPQYGGYRAPGNEGSREVKSRGCAGLVGRFGGCLRRSSNRFVLAHVAGLVGETVVLGEIFAKAGVDLGQLICHCALLHRPLPRSFCPGAADSSLQQGSTDPVVAIPRTRQDKKESTAERHDVFLQRLAPESLLHLSLIHI